MVSFMRKRKLDNEFKTCNQFFFAENFKDQSGLNRDQLLKRSDIFNIERKFGLRKYRKHENDMESVKIWVEEGRNSEDNPFFYFYPLKEDNGKFILGKCSLYRFLLFPKSLYYMVYIFRYPNEISKGDVIAIRRSSDMYGCDSQHNEMERIFARHRFGRCRSRQRFSGGLVHRKSRNGGDFGRKSQSAP